MWELYFSSEIVIILHNFIKLLRINLFDPCRQLYGKLNGELANFFFSRVSRSMSNFRHSIFNIILVRSRVSKLGNVNRHALKIDTHVRCTCIFVLIYKSRHDYLPRYLSQCATFYKSLVVLCCGTIAIASYRFACRDRTVRQKKCTHINDDNFRIHSVIVFS